MRNLKLNIRGNIHEVFVHLAWNIPHRSRYLFKNGYKRTHPPSPPIQKKTIDIKLFICTFHGKKVNTKYILKKSQQSLFTICTGCQCICFSSSFLFFPGRCPVLWVVLRICFCVWFSRRRCASGGAAFLRILGGGFLLGLFFFLSSTSQHFYEFYKKTKFLSDGILRKSSVGNFF